jgi:PST family polysaccharide transporter
MGLKAKTIAGITWTAADQVFRQVIRFGITVVLARLLSPTEFGLIAMMGVFTGFAGLFTSLGFGASLVQKKDLRPEHLDTVFWLNLGTGFFLALLMASLAPLIARFYGEPVLLGLTLLGAITFVFSSLNVVQNALLQKAMNFRRVFGIQMAATCIGGTVAVVMAINGFGPWSLVTESVVAAGVGVIAMWYGSSWRPRFIFDRSALRELFGFSGNLLAFNIANYWSRNFDSLLIGKVLGSAAAGTYHRSYQLMLLPLSNITQSVSRVMFPALASIQHDIPKVRSVFLRGTRIISLITFPAMILLMVLAEPAILLVYGEKWKEVIPIFQILCFSGLSQSVGNANGWIYMSQGRTDIQFRWSIVTTGVRIIAFLIGIRWGVIGVAASYVLSGYLILWYPGWSIAGRMIGLKFGEMVGNVAPPFLCSLFMALVVWALDSFLLGAAPYWLRFSAGGLTAVFVYLSLLLLFRVEALKDLIAATESHRNGLSQRFGRHLK